LEITDDEDDEELSDIDGNLENGSDGPEDDPNFDEDDITKNQDLLGSDDENGTDRPAVKRIRSTFEKEQERMAKMIADLEEENIAEKEWMLRGEVAAHIRPINSLLEQDVDFEQISRAAPPVTEEVTQTLEQIIRQRIQDKAWDDVERREAELPIVQAMKGPEISSEKSQKSLSQVYEESAISAAAKGNDGGVKTMDENDGSNLDPKTKAAHDEIKILFAKICNKIDALSHFKFTPQVRTLTEMQIKGTRYVRDAKGPKGSGAGVRSTPK
jgi:U3 small nucleolar RNA-associated protein MPP10